MKSSLFMGDEEHSTVTQLRCRRIGPHTDRMKMPSSSAVTVLALLVPIRMELEVALICSMQLSHENVWSPWKQHKYKVVPIYRVSVVTPYSTEPTANLLHSDYLIFYSTSLLYSRLCKIHESVADRRVWSGGVHGR